MTATGSGTLHYLRASESILGGEDFMRMRLLLLLACVTALCFSQATLTNDSIIKMVKAGLSEDIVLSSVHSQPGRYATGADDLIALKSAGVSDKIIAAMMRGGGGRSEERRVGEESRSRG